MNNSNFNTNINDYNIEDLLNLLELNDPSKEEIIEWAICWPLKLESNLVSFCNTIPTIEGGSHENGFKVGVNTHLTNKIVKEALEKKAKCLFLKTTLQF